MAASSAGRGGEGRAGPRPVRAGRRGRGCSEAPGMLGGTAGAGVAREASGMLGGAPGHRSPRALGERPPGRAREAAPGARHPRSSIAARAGSAPPRTEPLSRRLSRSCPSVPARASPRCRRRARSAPRPRELWLRVPVRPRGCPEPGATCSPSFPAALRRWQPEPSGLPPTRGSCAHPLSFGTNYRE